MNNVYHALRGQFRADKSYGGKEIHDAVLSTVKVRYNKDFTSVIDVRPSIAQLVERGTVVVML